MYVKCGMSVFCPLDLKAYKPLYSQNAICMHADEEARIKNVRGRKRGIPSAIEVHIIKLDNIQ